MNMYKIPVCGTSIAVGEYDNSSSMHVSRSHLTLYAGLCWKSLVVMAGALLTTAPHQVNGATIDARSPALADVATAIALAKEGDTVNVPSGTATWTSMLNVTKGITLSGQTTVSGAGTSATATDNTIIVDGVTTQQNVISITINSNQSFRLTGFTFRPNPTNPGGTTTLACRPAALCLRRKCGLTIAISLMQGGGA